MHHHRYRLAVIVCSQVETATVLPASAQSHSVWGRFFSFLFPSFRFFSFLSFLSFVCCAVNAAYDEFSWTFLEATTEFVTFFNVSWMQWGNCVAKCYGNRRPNEMSLFYRYREEQMAVGEGEGQGGTATEDEWNEMPLNRFTIYNLHSTQSVCLSVCLSPDLHTHTHTHATGSFELDAPIKKMSEFFSGFVSWLVNLGRRRRRRSVLILDLINSSALPNEMEGYLSAGATRGGGGAEEQVARNLVMIYE